MTDEIKGLVERLKAHAGKRAPVQGLPGGIPWAMHLRAYDAYCKRWGRQDALIDLEGKGCRGGFGTEELDSFIPGWRAELESPMPPDLATQAAAALTLSDEARVRAEEALGLALEMLGRLEPGDSRAVSSEFVAMARVAAGTADDECMEIIRKAQALILRAENLGSSVVESAALLAPQANCSAAQSLDGKGEPPATTRHLLRHKLRMGGLGGGPIFDALGALETLVSYGRWQVGPESLSHHPTLPSAVAAAEAALESALVHLSSAPQPLGSAREATEGNPVEDEPRSGVRHGRDSQGGER